LYLVGILVGGPSLLYIIVSSSHTKITLLYCLKILSLLKALQNFGQLIFSQFLFKEKSLYF